MYKQKHSEPTNQAADILQSEPDSTHCACTLVEIKRTPNTS